jgi:hypothetical protein
MTLLLRIGQTPATISEQSHVFSFLKLTMETQHFQRLQNQH